MKIVTDSGSDLSLEECKAMGVTMLPLKVEINGKSYQSGFDITQEEFYELMDKSPVMPITSTPSIGEFVEAYKKLAKEDAEIISIHISSGLSSTFNTAKLAAKQIRGAHIHLIDTLTLSGGTAVQVKAAVELAKAGLSTEAILPKLLQIQNAVHTYFTLPDLKYLIAGGRISHLKGLMGSLLGIRPVIEINKQDGKYYDISKERTFLKAIAAIPVLLLKKFPEGSILRAQVCSAANPEGAEEFKFEMEKLFRCEWLPTLKLGPALGAHTGRGLVGVICAQQSALPVIPGLTAA